MISIIVSVYNDKDGIESCIRSIMGQSFADFELIIVDDASDIAIGDCVRDYTQADSRIKYLRNRINRGQAFSRNKAAINALGSILVFTDSDCTPDKDWLAKIIEPIANRRADVVKGTTDPQEDSGVWAKLEWVWTEQYKGFDPKNSAIRRSVFENLGGFDNNFSPMEDVEFDIRLEKACFCIYYTDARVKHRYCNSLIRNFRKMWIQGEVFYRCLLRSRKSFNFREYLFRLRYAFFRHPFVYFKDKRLKLRLKLLDPFYRMCFNFILPTRAFYFYLMAKIKRVIRNALHYLILRYPRTFLVFRKMFIRKTHQGSCYKLAVLTLFVTNKCNLSCKYCFLKDSSLVKQVELEFSEIKKTLSGFRYPLEEIVITGGEPFLNKDLERLCTFIDRNEIAKTISIPTNGSQPDIVYNITKRIIKDNAINIKILVSIDGPEDVHDSLRNKKGSFDSAIQTLSMLKELCDASPNFDLNALTVISKDNIADIKGLIKLLIRYDIKHVFNLIRGSHISTFHIDEKMSSDLEAYEARDNMPSIKELQRAYLSIYRSNKKAKFKFLHPAQTPIFSYLLNVLEYKKRLIPCFCGYRTGVLYSSGDLALCEMTKPIGNIRETNYVFNELWDTEKADLFRQKMKKCACTHECALFDSLSG